MEQDLPPGFIKVVGLRGDGFPIAPENREVNHAVGKTEHHHLFEYLGKTGCTFFAFLLHVFQIPELRQDGDVLRIGLGARFFDGQAGVFVELAQQSPQLLP